MSGGAGGDAKSYNHKKRSSVIEDNDDDPDDNENDEDHTARLSDDRRRSFPKAGTPDNQAALQRVKSLTQRNRMVRGIVLANAHLLTFRPLDHLDLIYLGSNLLHTLLVSLYT